MNGAAEAIRNLLDAAPRHQRVHDDAAAMLDRFAVSEEQVMMMSETRMIWREIIASSHVAVWSAPGNGGKTTIAKEAAADLSHDGFAVFFFQEDSSAGDLPMMFEHAKLHGYKLLNSTLTGAAPEDQIGVLYKMVESGADLSNIVLFFDTLKKFADLMRKHSSREFFRLMRALTQRGATVVLLGHTNKHKGPDDKPIFEGVGDVRNDVDEMIYIESIKDARGIVTMTMRPDKVRCVVKEATFQLDTATMQVTALAQPVDVASILRREAQLQEDAALIEVVRGLLRNGGMPKTALVERITEAAGVGKRTATAVVSRYLGRDTSDTGALWIETHLRTNNIRHVSLPPRQ